jgi:carboxypeptidase C (cathepsin A)
MQKAFAVISLCVFLAVHEAAGLSFGVFSKRQQDSLAHSKPNHGEITSLPGYSGQLASKHYGGYISVGSRQLYYYMVESERTPADDPVV